MNARQAFAEAQSTDHVAAMHSNGYSAYLRQHDDDNTYSIAFCQGMMPPHSVESFDTADEMFQFLESHGSMDGWTVEEIE